MLVLKGDVVRTSSGLSGEITDIWGIARPWAKLRQEDGQSAFILRTDVTEIVKRPPPKKGKR
ncbi:hypothetical protein NST48_09235 [Paenibacillus sp. FSL M7-0547]|uniref:hypothetical protein n=1 Tax=Paenibacillus sp. FSL M7-0547 TaxID=2954755 RepID=UPI0030F558B0